ncbi:TonB-dependent receptor [Pseudoalteromonas sp. NZS127_1]|uniref:TonB-dependent receptor n=2 Tax=Gammaproteobacteria TaxID=1236 RepID=A0AAP6XY95_9GAMM|nr:MULTISPECIES: TonB-dependent receptor [Pseudoalteromonas]MBG9991647.1 TonB-dependent receptor [Pseudoalteromonas sp. NZS37]MBG9994614.1 TonB-dependent receptor [Pseudoalteromonas sp. NZS127_1]MBG9997410.1 TonB-dependent receptor [Pseudoalteromonas sp. NSLLW24]MBH0012537.1 TonB-dependent receptor [Pseudoalteromonas sp. NZS100_1]MBH0034675.1 TonB-dependent receptor [Pseudoalteromonas sp. NZS71_1]
MKKSTLGLAVIAAIPMFSSVQVLAADEAATSIEKIQVTGSRINRTDMETASPITVIGDDFIAKSGFTSVADILSTQPSAAGISLGASSNNGSGGSATVNLRGMGSQRTLVLLNGRRMVSSGTGADSSVDLNTIPVAMIKSIEILKDGASAVYGSDAIAGVVNIITKKDFEGSELNVEGSRTTKGDGNNYGVSLLHGMNIADGNLVVGAQYSNRGEVIQSDRRFVEPGESSFIPEGTLGGRTYQGNGVFADRTTSYDFTTSSYAQTPNELYSLFTSFDKELDSDTTFNVDLMYTRRESNQQLAPQPASIDLSTSSLDSTYTDSFRDADTGDLADSLEYRRRMVDAGPRIYEQETDTYRVSVALQGLLDNDASWDVSATYGRNDSKDKVQNSINASRVEESIYANQALWFSGDSLDRSLLTSNDSIYTESNEGGNEQFILSAGYSAVTESDIGYAIGVENRFESGYYTPDLITQLGESTAAQQDPTEGDFSVQSIYFETSMPVLETVTLEGAARYDNYSTFGGETTWKLGATWNVTEEFMVRSVLATGFRAPNVSELFGGNSGSYDYLADPWGNEQDAQILVNYTSDNDLKAEESRSFTFGMVWEVADGLSTTLDYWKFDITNAITRLDVQNEMNSCFAGDSESCSSVNITQSGDLSNLSSALTNVGSQETSGVDWNISYSADNYRINLDTTYLIKFEEDDINYTGTIDGNIGGYSKIKSNLSVNYDLTDSLNILYNARFLRGMDGDYYGENFSTDNVIYHDISMSYNLNDALRFTGGMNNIFDKEPEKVLGGNDMGTVPEVYDVIGSRVFASVNYKF